MRCLIINPNWRDAREVGRMCSIKTPTFPIELLYISDDLNRNGINNKVLDLWAEDKHLEDYRDEIKNSDYIVLTTAPTYCYWRDGTINADLPKRMLLELKSITNASVIIIGPHGSIDPDLFKNLFQDVLVVRGEPDLAVAELIKKLMGGVEPNIEKNNIVENLDNLPLLSFSQSIDFTSYHVTETPDDYSGYGIFYETSRGCPFNCIFCFRAGFRNKLRLKSPERVEKEVRRMKELSLDYIYLIDETFGVNKEWCSEIAKIMERYNIIWGFQTRPELLDCQWIDELYKKGCRYIYIGLEAVNREIAKNLGKGIEDLNEFKKVLNYMIEKGITPFLSMIIGSPGETKETIKEMEDFLMELDDRVKGDICILLPYPNTEIWEMGKKEGKQLISWNDVTRYAGTIGNNLTQIYVRCEERRINMMLHEKRNRSLWEKPFIKLGFIYNKLFFRFPWLRRRGRW